MKNELTILEKEFNYSYNESNYIFEIYDSFDNRISKYTYDSKGRLISEANDELGRIFTYSYDNNGNILTENVYDTNMTLLSSNSYLYNSENGWSDQLTSYNGSTITYDSIGNPLLYKDGMSMSWENGKELSQIIKGENTFSYKYNSQGIRIGKTVNGVEHIYTLEGSRILSESYGNITMLYIYDETNSPIGIAYRENDYAKGVFDYYLFLKNLQGDIIGICNSSYELISEYTYNAWGECTITNYTEDNIGNVNPFRYRGYYHDSETGFYYLNSRYYDPQIKRFINADDISYMDPITLTGINLYAYCDNNPVMYVDPSGHFIISSFLIGLGISTLIGAASGGIFYVGSELVSYATTGQFSWSWGDFFGSVTGGAVGNALSFLGVGPFASGFIANFTSLELEAKIEGTQLSLFVATVSSTFAGVFSEISPKVMGKFKIKGFNIGKGNYSAIAKQIYKKLFDGTIKHVSFKNILKIFTIDYYNNIAGNILYDIYEQKIKDNVQMFPAF